MATGPTLTAKHGYIAAGALVAVVTVWGVYGCAGAMFLAYPVNAHDHYM